MNASIYGMNHSPLTQEPDSRPLDFENDILALSGMYLNFTDHEHAFEFAKSLTGKSYSEKCAAYVTALDELAALWIDMGDTPVSELEIDALVAFANDTEAPARDEGGARFTISGGEVAELPDSHLESDYDDRNGDGFLF